METRAARRWLSLAVAALIVAGSLALLLVVGRMPPFDRWFTDAQFFRRCLVVHVDLSLVVWLYAAVAGLVFLLPARGESAPWTRAGPALSAAGVVGMVLAPVLTRAEPVLANYIPVLDHPLFVLGLLVFGAGVLLSLLDGRLLPEGGGVRPPAVIPLGAAPRTGLRAAALALILAALTFYASALSRPDGVTIAVHYELLLWGGGHVLQVASVAAMLSVWLILVESYTGRAPLSPGAGSTLFGLLLAPWFAAPLIARTGTQDAASHGAFTMLMRWGIFPVASVVLLACVGELLQARRDGRTSDRRMGDVRLLGFIASGALTALGFVLGALIRGSTTMVPAHYHASVGGVTASFMAAALFLAAPLGMPLRGARLARLAAWQPALYGVGQVIFALGFAIAGAQGMARKTYGHEQVRRTVTETAGLAVMGVGGLVAVGGGLLFLYLAVRAWRAAPGDPVEIHAPLAQGGPHV